MGEWLTELHWNRKVGGDFSSMKNKCVPFVSEYSNCNDENLCSGCSKCACNAEGKWNCKDVQECGPADDEYGDMDAVMDAQDDIMDTALRMMELDMEKKKLNSIKKSAHPNVPTPYMNFKQDALMEMSKQFKAEQFYANFERSKRSASTKHKNKHSKRSVDKDAHNKHTKATNTSSNNTIKFFDVVDELNLDTLKDSNVTGTVVAMKMDMLPKLTAYRRSGDASNGSKSLQIEYNHPKVYNQINDNKIETAEHDSKFDRSHENIKTVLGNYTQTTKDKDLSKIVVNELKKGSEVIGDASAPVTSNITFTPENDTLTAMAFIAGNLLNKLWNMEKDATATSMETDMLKQEKIADLLDLFKEPLNIRQETFLKNALEQLSSALDKDKNMKNTTICEQISEATKLLYDTNSTSEEERPKMFSKLPCKKIKVEGQKEQKQKKATVKAISKINNVLDLIKKFQNIQGYINELKLGPKEALSQNHTQSINLSTTRTSNNKAFNNIDTLLTKEENNSLNLFGNIAEKITKLLLPKRNNKKIENLIRSQHVLSGNDLHLKKQFQKMYNIDLTNMTVTAKDKIILDYLTHVEGNPDCLLNNNKNRDPEKYPTLEGNILLNLSEFFKMKSFSDLISLLDQEKKKEVSKPIPVAKEIVEPNTTLSEKKMATRYKVVDSNKLKSTKEKLKLHLRTIIEDLIELQNAKGVSISGNIKVADALPCIYNVLKAAAVKEEVVATKQEHVDPIHKITSIFKGLKKDLKSLQARRTIVDTMKVRPKSAIVWERLVRRLNAQAKYRRTGSQKLPKSYEKIKDMMDIMENSSSSYKNYALLVKIPPAGKLMMLKALEQEVKKTISIINDIRLSFNNLTKLPTEKFAELEQFVENMGAGIKLSEKVDEKMKPELRKFFVNEINSNNKLSKNKLKKKNTLRYSETRSRESDDFTVSRVQLMNQLIKNRMQKFIKMKETSELDLNSKMAYNIAQSILYNLDTGNYKLANEMYKIFLMQKQNEPGTFSKSDAADKYVVTSTPKLIETPMRRMLLHQQEPLEDPTRIKSKITTWANQDQLIKQLLNMKTMGL